jgi:MFS family permease
MDVVFATISDNGSGTKYCNSTIRDLSGGNIGEVAIITALQSGSVAIGSLAWGKIIDRFHAKKMMLVISSFFVLLCSIAMYFTNSVYVVYTTSPILGFFMVARNPVMNLLVMESI